MSKPTGKLPGDYIAGFVDGEGCFALKFRRDIRRERQNSPEYFYWKAEFAIGLRIDDGRLLELIRDTLGCGSVTENKDYNQVRYSVQDLEKLYDIIIPFFQTHRLYGKKWADFILWVEAVEILRRNKKKKINAIVGTKGFLSTNWNAKDVKRLREIHEAMKPLKSKGNPWKWLNSERTS